MTAQESLRLVRLFSGLSGDELKQLAETAASGEVDPATILIEQNEHIGHIIKRNLASDLAFKLRQAI